MASASQQTTNESGSDQSAATQKRTDTAENKGLSQQDQTSTQNQTGKSSRSTTGANQSAQTNNGTSARESKDNQVSVSEQTNKDTQSTKVEGRTNRSVQSGGSQVTSEDQAMQISFEIEISGA